ncbi:MAG: hypothetical protein LBE98_02840 [Puniceicoccales bacterium]|nr:hypothetical protein [Puniceicoccales bacterium]
MKTWHVLIVVLLLFVAVKLLDKVGIHVIDMVGGFIDYICDMAKRFYEYMRPAAKPAV